MSPPLALGLDFGTSFSSAAVHRPDGTTYARDESGSACIPSVIYLPPTGAPVVGAPALARAAAEPQRVVRNLKRILGCPFNHPAVRLFQAQNAVHVHQGARGEVLLSTPEQTYAPKQLAAQMLRHIKLLADCRFDQDMKYCVMTLPEGCTPEHRKATLQSAQMAGLHVFKTVEEPIAAATAFGAQKFEGHRQFLVFDFGGGTFDATVIEQRGPFLTVLASGGDTCLGGCDFDDALAHLAAGKIFRHERYDVSRNAVEWALVEQRAEDVKRALSSKESARFITADIFTQPELQTMDLRVTRDEAEARFRPLVDRALKRTAEIMVDARVSPADLAGTVMVGGSTLLPLVQRRVQDVLRKPGLTMKDPQMAVAIGAAQIASEVVTRAAA